MFTLTSKEQFIAMAYMSGKSFDFDGCKTALTHDGLLYLNHRGNVIAVKNALTVKLRLPLNPTQKDVDLLDAIGMILDEHGLRNVKFHSVQDRYFAGGLPISPLDDVISYPLYVSIRRQYAA